METIFSELRNWYISQCNGNWEHQWGIKINTLDNPGWEVIVDLNETEDESTLWDDLRVDNGKEDWIFCKKEGKQFRGYGDPTKLQSILEYFLSKTKGATATSGQLG